ncbi:MAG TPA: hypothetical protein VJ912_03395 [Candidatus Nanoarchaeia archaeon]|nr:hypothetical protein [Candidatus Nanoarchaeia archaeon]
MYTNEKKKQVEEFKKYSTTLGKFILEKGASPKINFSDNKTKRFFGKILRMSIADWAVSWLTPKEQEAYTKLYNERPWLPAIKGSVGNLAVTGYPIFKGMEVSSDIAVSTILGGVYGLYLAQNISRSILSIKDNKGYPPPALVTLAANSQTYAKRFKDNYHYVIEGLSSTAQAQGIIDPVKLPQPKEQNLENKVKTIRYLTFKGN